MLSAGFASYIRPSFASNVKSKRFLTIENSALYIHQSKVFNFDTGELDCVDPNGKGVGYVSYYIRGIQSAMNAYSSFTESGSHQTGLCLNISKVLVHCLTNIS